MLVVTVYMQMHTTLAVYLRDVHGNTKRAFGLMMGLNAAIVVIFQIPVTRWIKKDRAQVLMMVGSLLYAVGFGMYAFVSTFPLFLVAVVVMTVGEMIVSLVGQAIVAHLAPENLRGRYMAAFGFGWVLPTAVGPLLAGLVMDNLDPVWVRYASIVLAIIAVLAFYLLMKRSDKDLKFQ